MLPVAIMCNNRTAVTELFQRDQQITILYMFRFTPSRSTSFYSIPKKKKFHCWLLANLLQKPCTSLMAGELLQVTSLQKAMMSGGGSEAQT